MSLFDFELPHVQAVIFDPAKQISGTGSGAPAQGLPNGSLWYDVSNGFNTISPTSTTPAGLNVAIPTITTPVTNVNPTSATSLMTYAFPAGSLNTKGRTISLFAAGEITTGVGTTTTFTILLNDGTNVRTIDSFTTGALTTGQTNLPWEINATIVVSASGTSGTVFSHGGFIIPLTAPTAAVAEYLDQNTASSSSLNLTLGVSLAIASLFGTSNGSNSVTQDLMTLDVAF